MGDSTGDDAAVVTVSPLDSDEAFLVPDYGGRCITELVPVLMRLQELKERDAVPDWVPPSVADASNVVLLILDGLGAEQLASRSTIAPTMTGMAHSTLTSVAPTTTAAALTSIVTGHTPAEHGVVGYRLRVGGEVLNVLRWTTPSGDARSEVRPRAFQRLPPFLGQRVPVISKAEFAHTGFTEAHLFGVDLIGYRLPSSLPVLIEEALRRRAPFVYAYYDGIDAIAHMTGLGAYYEAEVHATDQFIAEIVDRLPKGSALVISADHGQVEVTAPPLRIDEEVMVDVEAISGEGRFRWLHARPGAIGRVATRAKERFGEACWVETLDELVDAGIFGGPLPDAFRRRLGDVALMARAPVAIIDPADPGDARLIGRHGSLTKDELIVPLLGAAA
ncbi:MAG: alkaline phosphatase family protein [Acidimicrobiales bacterium]